MTIEEFADVLRDPNAQLIDHDTYISDTTKLHGYKAKLVRNGQYYFYSVSATRETVSPSAVADAITSPKRVVTRPAPDPSGGMFETTVRCGEHSYMLWHRARRR
jgi:hypothetical protein